MIIVFDGLGIVGLLLWMVLWSIVIPFVPPLLLAFTFEAWWLQPPGARAHAPSRKILTAWGITVIGTGLAMGAASAIVSPSLLKPLMLKEFWLGTLPLPLSPAAFAAVGVATATVVFVLMPVAGSIGRCSRRGPDRWP